MNIVENCENCKFWLRGDGEYGSCRRHAPPAVSYVNNDVCDPEFLEIICLFPQTFEEQWCGDYLGKNAPVQSGILRESPLPLDTKGAAIYTGFTVGHLAKMRCYGDGPVFIKRKGRVLYDPYDLDSWLNSLKRRSTSET